MFKKAVAVLLCIFSVLMLTSCSSGGRDAASSLSDGKIRVSVTFDALAEFVQAVGKDRVDVSRIIPDGTEPHDFEPKAKDLAALSEAKVFVYNGLGMETWAQQAVDSAGSASLVAVDASKGAEPIRNTDAGQLKEHGQYDPHLWLSLKGAEIEAKNIRDGLIRADPAGKEAYTKNCDTFLSELESLYTSYRTKFSGLKSRNFVTGHAAFAYLCRDFGLEQHSVEDVFAEGEPSAKRLGELVDYCKKNAVKTVFVEEMVSPSVSKTLAQQVGAKVETIYTVESSESGKSYLARMEANLQEIYAALSA